MPGYRSGSTLSVALKFSVDGGEVYWQENDAIRVLVYKLTNSLPVSQSWTTDDVRLTTIDKGDAIVLNRATLWPATAGSGFFSFNGDISQAL
jgi:hypothetical protein